MPIDKESKKYIRVIAKHIIKTFVGDEMTTTINKYELTRCSKEFFSRTAFERKFYDTYLDGD